MNDFLSRIYVGNTISNWLIAICGIIIGITVIRIIKAIALKKLKKLSVNTKTTIDDFIVKLLEKFIIPLLQLFILYLALSYLELPKNVDNILNIAILFICTYYVLRIINAVIQYTILSFLKQQDDGVTKQSQAKGLLVIIKVIVWLLGIVFLLDNFGYNVNTIVAGLGIGGIAIALAAQNILGDLFSYFSILFDRPFEIGDFINVDGKAGVIEHIGIKTTRLRNLEGDQLVCSNKNLTDAAIHNYKRMEKRRVTFSLGVTYQTDADTLEKIPPMVKKIIEDIEDVTFDRGHFSNFGDSSLNFDFVYFVSSSDFNKHMDIKQKIYLKIYRIFEDNGIEFAYPTQTLFVNKEVSEKTEFN